MERYDAIVIGGGMAGLSTAAFLGLGGRSVVVLERHDKVGGLASSFELRGLRFDIGIEGLRELAPDSFLQPFLRWWGVDLPLEARAEVMDIFTNGGGYRIRGENAREDMRAAFPALGRRIDRFFDLNARIFKEMTGGGRPKAPSSMSLLEKLAFGISSAVKRPNFMRYGLSDTSRVLPGLLRDPDLIRIAASKTFDEMVYFSIAYRWEALRDGRLMYPTGGIGALPEAIAASIRTRGGEILTKAEAVAARPSAGGYTVDCKDGRSFEARTLIVAAPMPWAAFSLFRDEPRFEGLRAGIRKRKAFPACFISFLALDPSFDLGGANYVVDWGDEGAVPALWEARRQGGGLGPETAPIACVVAGAGRRPGEGSPVAMTAMTTLDWDRAARWGTRDGSPEPRDADWLGAPEGYRASEGYLRAKGAAESAILDRLGSRLGPGFREAVLFSSSSTPLSFARHTNGPFGSYMGFSIRSSEYGRFFPQRGPLPNMFFAGQWVFPGFGVAGAAASGYFAAQALLEDEGFDLDARLRELE